METRDALLELRRDLGLSQEEFAQKLWVTRQAVSRWETGETVPSTDTLKEIAKVFQVPVDRLLGYPAGFCQSCGMVLTRDEERGPEADGSRSEAYCTYCYQQGRFLQNVTMEEMAEHNLQFLAEWNRANRLDLDEAEARAGLLAFLPTLKRWRRGETERVSEP